jgi:hypothetical protein
MSQMLAEGDQTADKMPVTLVSSKPATDGDGLIGGGKGQPEANLQKLPPNYPSNSGSRAPTEGKAPPPRNLGRTKTR